MTVRTLPIWVILSTVGIVVLLMISHSNYHVSSIGKIRAKCLSKKPPAQRNNAFIRIKKRVSEAYYPWMAFIVFIIVSISFCVENHKLMPSTDYLILSIIINTGIWLIMAFFATIILVSLMKLCQEDALRDLKSYYFQHYGVSLIYIDKIDEERYYELFNR